AHGLMFAAKIAAESVVAAAAAPALFAVAYALAGKVVQEWVALDILEQAAVAAAPLVALYRNALPLIAGYSDRMALQAPFAIRAAVSDAAGANGMAAAQYPLLPTLPVSRESESRGRGGQWPRKPGSGANPTRHLIPAADLRPTAV